MRTSLEIQLPRRIVVKYLNSLVGQFYKILPMKESGEETLGKYMMSLQREMLGCKSLIVSLDDDELYLRLMSILQYLIENECDVGTVKTEVFKAIELCKLLKNKYYAGGYSE